VKHAQRVSSCVQVGLERPLMRAARARGGAVRGTFATRAAAGLFLQEHTGHLAEPLPQPPVLPSAAHHRYCAGTGAHSVRVRVPGATRAAVGSSVGVWGLAQHAPRQPASPWTQGLCMSAPMRGVDAPFEYRAATLSHTSSTPGWPIRGFGLLSRYATLRYATLR